MTTNANDSFPGKSLEEMIDLYLDSDDSGKSKAVLQQEYEEIFKSQPPLSTNLQSNS